ncbi:hypothetical protein GLAREA_01107 [Glarea lozoyensis ATCC 20868]|uniref:Uncharacterized protein n=1 Tax=Glarea lozoyensis (strain ATCC 20868 / MF5171) TaxID=1116229 RepID=S3CU58_GLAL2|nr:uncharacterized protein GLAREA_01107 [Glarea lozoyensis ATCC 20868]EPE29947.1 hypothetical protein GLAREA_01107 [Glarea lozoyensis ATCC 20868]
MEGPQSQRRDINELLTRGFFTTARGKSPNPPNPQLPPRPSAYHHSHLSDNTQDEPRYERPRGRVRRQRGPKPTVEEEAVSLARESFATSKAPTYEPPLRGIIDQIPLILEADVTAGEAARLQVDPECKNLDAEKNDEKRFVFIPKAESSLNTSEEDFRRRKEAKRKETSQSHKSETKKRDDILDRGDIKEIRPQAPPLQRSRSRQDLPTLETKLSRETRIPPQFRRSASAFAVSPIDTDKTPKADASNAHASSNTNPGDYFLSPDAIRSPPSFSSSAPRYNSPGTFGDRINNTSTSERRPSSRSGTPSADKRSSGSFETSRQDKRSSGSYHIPLPRQESYERLRRPKQSSDEHAAPRMERRASGYSDRPSTGHSSRSNHSNHSRHYYSSSEDELVDSDDDRSRGRDYREPKIKKAFPTVDDYSRGNQSPSKSNRSSLDSKGRSKPGSRLVSPLPSPGPSPSHILRGDEYERSQTFPRETEKRRDTRPISPHSAVENHARKGLLNPFEAPSIPMSMPRTSGTPTPPNQSTPYPTNTSMPIPIPPMVNMYSQGDSPRNSMPRYNETKDATPRPPESKPYWQPPPFAPPIEKLERPMGVYRRQSEDIQRGSIPPLPTCPRMQHTRGRNDWLTLPNCPPFNICPQCFNNTIASTDFRNHFILAPQRPPDAAVRCDFGSSPWYRIAWLLTLKERRRDLKLFYGLAHIASTEPPCLGKQEGVRKWHSIIDHKTGSTIPNFDVCPNCVKSIEILLPPIRGVFVPKKQSSSNPSIRLCDLRFDSKRFVQYFDALEVTSDTAARYDEEPDTRSLVSMTRRLSQLEECEGSKDLFDRKWHIITQLPEFTVCEECFDEVVWPEMHHTIPKLFAQNRVRLPKASCQLYSERMRKVFRDACHEDDYKMLASRARERKSVEGAWKKDLKDLRERVGLGFESGALAREVERVEEEWRRWE